MNEDILRLVKLVEHWIEHNDQHGKRFREEAESAENMELNMVADEIRLAAEASENVSESLSRALKHLVKSDYDV
jgi:hypothetical protein